MSYSVVHERVRRSAALARRALCVAAVVAVTFPALARDDHVETAMYAPAVRAAGGAALPQPLSTADAERYARIFTLQETGDWKAADREIARLEDRVLLGHVLAQRYLHPRKYRSRYRELSRWLAKYNDHPDARTIYKLAMKRKPRKARAPRRPARGGGAMHDDPLDAGVTAYVSPRHRSTRLKRRARSIKHHIRRLVRLQRLTIAENELKRRDFRRVLDDVEMDELRARVGAGWFLHGNDARALALAGPAAEHSGRHLPFAHWTAGLVAYRMGKHHDAARHFEAMAQSAGLSDWHVAAAAFWAARANMVSRRPDRVAHWLGAAAGKSRTFYGLLARRILGLPSPFQWSRAALKQEQIEALTQDGRTLRALALLQLGRTDRAERELRAASGMVDPELATAYLAIADRAGMPALALRAATTLAATGDKRHHYGLYPVPRWEPEGGFRVDRAVIYAFMRQESAFKVRAKSHAGARGLMQLMPATASYIAKKRFRGRARNQLFDPELNIALGQKYLSYLIGHDAVNGDMFLVAAAYNGGPGNLARWQRRVWRRSTDPLMFIESIPSRETREFIERVLANLWIYRERLGQPAPSLDAIAAGRRPVYKALDSTRVAAADDGRD